MSGALEVVPDHPALDCADCRSTGSLRLVRKPERWGGSSKLVYRCVQPGCSGLLSAHPDGRPTGVPADAETRRARRLTHAKMDALWRDAWKVYNLTETGRAAERARKAITVKARTRTYAWLADQMGMSADDCHISMMDLVQLRAAYAAIQRATFHSIREWAKERGK